ncbi:MAG TPA: DUF3488 and transglutaminase-like domain-containing protein [Steroidobacteraceae bacterium]|nr:DUF3488 and transglutaminase-like domain-containing protein [Steroidobacteraceae bacterium]
MASAPQAADGEALRSLAWACAAFAGGVLLNLERVPSWTAATALLLIAWRLATERSGLRLPGTVARALLALGVVAVVLWRFHTLNGLAAGTAMLMLMSALKLLETRARRDQFVMVGAGLFLLLAACLDRQSLVRVPLYALQVWLCCSALAVVASAGCEGRAALRLAGRSLLLALPLAVLLFLFFPRLQGAFWAIPRGGEALTGLSDTMSPGSIVKLVASYNSAFRVQFAARAPPAEELYWRGPVLHDFDGHTWRRASGAFHLRQRLQYLGTPYRYRVALEPTRQRWWFALDTPAQSSDANVLLTYDNQLLGAEALTEPLSFDAVSYTRTRALEPLGAFGRQQDTTLPPGNPRSVALAQTLRQRAGSDADFVQATLEYLRSSGFVYTLTPEALGADPVDDFLFDTRAGFCGHYASAFVTLMRAAQVPAHVVTGYLGGEWNPIGDYFLVRQSDAHAWAEVWLEGRGWTRIDPTAVVEPERLRRGVFDLLPDALATRERLLRGSAWLTRALQRWDAANAWWSDHVVKFDYSAQLDLLGRFGIRSPDVRYLGWAFMLALLGWLAIIAWHIGRSARPAAPDALARAYARLCRKLARIGEPRAPYQGPLSLAETLRARRPDLSDRVQPLLRRYTQLRYGPAAPATRAQDIEEFRRAVARLSLSRDVGAASVNIAR